MNLSVAAVSDSVLACPEMPASMSSANVERHNRPLHSKGKGRNIYLLITTNTTITTPTTYLTLPYTTRDFTCSKYKLLLYT